jgi:quercetin dioxygenase-like cupin family protein
VRARREQLPQPRQRSFWVYPVEAPKGFPFYWHFHPEYELTYILEGQGMRLVADHLAPFAPGDLVLLGPGLPHTWTSDTGRNVRP